MSSEPLLPQVGKSRVRANFELAGLAVCIPLCRYAWALPVGGGLWAEDGTVFLTDAVKSGWSVFWSYAGYGHLLPRLLSAIAVLFPVEWYAAIVAIAWSATVFASATVVGVCADRLGVSGFPKFVAVFGLFLVPGFGYEIVLALCNLQWVLLYVGAWIVAARLGNRSSVIALFVISASTPFAMFLVPLALYAHGRRRTVAKAAGAALAGSMFHVVCVIVGGQSITNPITRHPGAGPRQVASMVEHAIDAVSIPSDVSGAFWLLGQLVVVSWILLRARQREIALLWAGTGIAIYIVSSVLNGEAQSRYATTASGFVIASLAFAMSSERFSRALAAALVVAAFPWVLSQRVSPHRAPVEWSDTIADARIACTNGRDEAFLPVAPLEWHARVPCSRLGYRGVTGRIGLKSSKPDI